MFHPGCKKVFLVLGLSISFLLSAEYVMGADRFAEDRRYMVQEIAQDARDTSYYINKKELDPRVMAVMGKVERHKFVPKSEESWAYANRPLPIGHGQTISQPYIVALMTDLLNVEPGDRVLEVGTGSGYQAAVLAELVVKVFTIEIIEPLGRAAAKRLAKLQYKNIETKIADGYYGWPAEAPFDAIVVTAAASHIPPPLLRQLKPGGIMVIPVGSRFMVQQLVLVEKDESGEIRTRQILPVRFVPLTGKH
jgi:protein-L-isoaspartate(D-aspartate) O-methyltransferase